MDTINNFITTCKATLCIFLTKASSMVITMFNFHNERIHYGDSKSMNVQARGETETNMEDDLLMNAIRVKAFRNALLCSRRRSSNERRKVRAKCDTENANVLQSHTTSCVKSVLARTLRKVRSISTRASRRGSKKGNLLPHRRHDTEKEDLRRSTQSQSSRHSRGKHYHRNGRHIHGTSRTTSRRCKKGCRRKSSAERHKTLACGVLGTARDSRRNSRRGGSSNPSCGKHHMEVLVSRHGTTIARRDIDCVASILCTIVSGCWSALNGLSLPRPPGKQIYKYLNFKLFIFFSLLFLFS